MVCGQARVDVPRGEDTTIERDERAPRPERDERAREVIGGTVVEGDLHDGEMARTHVRQPCISST